MQITLLNTYFGTGGAAIACRRLTEALYQSGAQVRLLTQEACEAPFARCIAPGWLGEKAALLRLGLEKIALKPYTKKKNWFEFAYSTTAFGLDVTQIPEVREADVLHLHWVNHGLLSIETLGRLAKLGKPIVWTAHDMQPFTGGCFYSGACQNYQTKCGNCPYLARPAADDLSRKIWEKKYKAYQNLNLTVVTPSGWLRRCAEKSALLKGKNIFNIVNPLNTDVFCPMPQAEARTSLGLPVEGTYLLFGAANIADPRKGLAYLKTALESLTIKLPSDFALITLGGGDFEGFAGLKTYKLGHISEQKKLVAAYSACDAFILPSLEDNLPNTVVEALACGAPCVGFASGGVPEMISEGETGFLADAGSAPALAEAIQRRLTLSAAQAAEMRARARQTAVETYSYPKIAERFMELYKSLI